MTDDQKAFEAKWHLKRIRPLGNCRLSIKDYFVTAALLNHDGDTTILAIMAADYALDSKDWITIHVSPEELLGLDSRFEILGDWNPITFEITFRVHGEHTDEQGKTWWLADTVNHVNGVTTPTCPLSKELPLEIGAGLYDVCWVATDGRKLRDTVLMPSETVAKGHEFMHRDAAHIRNWIRTGRYHHTDWRQDPRLPPEREVNV